MTLLDSMVQSEITVSLPESPNSLPTRGPDASAVAGLLPQRVIELDPSTSSPATAAALAREYDRLSDLVKVGVVGDEVLEGRGL